MSVPDDWADDPSLRELQDLVRRLNETLGDKGQGEDQEETGADDVLIKANALKSMLDKMRPKAPDSFADRIVTAALELDPVPDPTLIHRLPK